MVLRLQQEAMEVHLRQVVDMELHPPQAFMVPHPLGVGMVHILQVGMAPNYKVVVINTLSKAMDSNHHSRTMPLKVIYSCQEKPKACAEGSVFNRFGS